MKPLSASISLMTRQIQYRKNITFTPMIEERRNRLVFSPKANVTSDYLSELVRPI